MQMGLRQRLQMSSVTPSSLLPPGARVHQMPRRQVTNRGASESPRGLVKTLTERPRPRVSHLVGVGGARELRSRKRKTMLTLRVWGPPPRGHWPEARGQAAGIPGTIRRGRCVSWGQRPCLCGWEGTGNCFPPKEREGKGKDEPATPSHSPGRPAGVGPAWLVPILAPLNITSVA